MSFDRRVYNIIAARSIAQLSTGRMNVIYLFFSFFSPPTTDRIVSDTSHDLNEKKNRIVLLFGNDDKILTRYSLCTENARLCPVRARNRNRDFSTTDPAGSKTFP